MADLTTDEMNAVKLFLSEQMYVKPRNPAVLDSTAFEAAAAAISTWVDANQVSYVAALPEPFKSNSTANEKSLVLIGVVVAKQGLTVD